MLGAIPRNSSAPPSASDALDGVVAVVDDDPLARRIARSHLESSGLQVIEFERGADAIGGVSDNVDAVCLDLGLDDIPGIDVLKHFRANHPDLPVIVVTANDEVETAVSVMRAGAYDYVVKPLNHRRFVHMIGRALDYAALIRSVRSLEQEVSVSAFVGNLVGESPAMRELARQVDRVKESDVTVCLFGESGTGKEIVARTIHQRSRRHRGPFVAVNCAAIPEALQESELFGHERGAFTGAVALHRGRLEQAQGGTLFLDELGEMAAAVQSKLLRALQERTVRRIGGSSDINIDVRIVCATHRDLESEVRSGRFREDLYYRLVVYPIHLPPLRKRTSDIPLLIAHFLKKLKTDVGRDVARVSPDALELLVTHSWPGNVRELENVIHRAMLSCDGNEITPAHLPPAIRNGIDVRKPFEKAHGEPKITPSDETPLLPLKELERRAIERALRTSDGSVTQAAKLLGMGRATLYRRLAELGLGVQREP